MPDWNFGATLSSPILLDKLFRRLAARKRKFWSLNAIPLRVKKLAVTGRSFAIAASTPINQFSIAGSANDFLFLTSVFSGFSVHSVLNSFSFENHAQV